MKAYLQERHLALWVTGKRVEGSWAHPDEDATFYELKAYVENILARLGIAQAATVAETSVNDIFAKALEIKTRGGKTLVEMGIVTRKLLKQADIAADVYYADINWTNAMKAIRKNKVEYTELGKYPSVSRDLALLVGVEVTFAQIVEVARQTEKKLLKKVELFDVYQGDNLPEGKKSYAVNFILQDEQKTLNDKQIDTIMRKLITNITNRLGAELR